MSDALSNEIQSFSAKRSSLRDKLKKRREALGSILSGVQAGTEEPPPQQQEQPKQPPRPPSPKKPDEVIKRSPPPAAVKEPPPAKAADDLMSLLSAPSAKEKADQEKREEILELLGKPTAKERSLIDSFKSSGGVQQFCTHSTKAECVKVLRPLCYL